MANTDNDPTSSDVVNALEIAHEPSENSAHGSGTLHKPSPGAHAPMGISQVTDSTSGQPMALDGTATIDSDPAETREWLDSLRYVVNSRGGDRASYLLQVIEQEAYRLGVPIPFLPTNNRHFRAIVKLSGELKASFAGTRWRWLCVLIAKIKVSADTSPHLPLRQRSWRWP